MRPMIDAVRRKFNVPLIGAEIGVRLGDNAHSILLNLPIKELVLVDIWDSACTGPTLKYKKVNQGTDVNYPRVIERFKDEDRVLIHRDYSTNAVKDYADDYFDFVYIDASHAYKNVKVDINDWWPKVKIGGIIGGHDYFYFVGVKNAVDEFAKDHDFKVESRCPDWWGERTK